MADNIAVTPGSGAIVASDEATYSGDTTKVQIIRQVHVDGSEGSKTVKELIRLEDAAHTSADPGMPILGVRQDTAASLAGTDGDYTMPIFDSAGKLHVNVGTSALPSGAATSAKQDTIIGHVDGIEGLLTSIDGDTGTLAGAVSGTEMQVDIVTSALPTGAATAAKQDTIIGHVDGIETLLGGTLAVSNAGLTELAAAIDTELQVDVVGALPAGTNALGKLLPPDVDVTAHANYAKKYYTNAGAVTDGIVWSPAAGKRWHIVSMHITTSAAATVTLEDDKAGGDEAVWKAELSATGGETIYFGEKYPLASGEDAADLLVTTSAGNIYITVVGYEV